MPGPDKFANRKRRDDLSKRQRFIRKIGLSPEKYVLGHGGDLIYDAWIGNTPDFLAFTKTLNMVIINNPRKTNVGTWGFQLELVNCDMFLH